MERTERTGLTEEDRRREIQEIRADLAARDLAIREALPVELRHMCADAKCMERENQ